MARHFGRDLTGIARSAKTKLLSKVIAKRDDIPSETQTYSGTKRISVQIAHLLLNDAAQIELVEPKLRDVLKGSPSCEKNSNSSGPFGMCRTNPIPVNGPIGELAYLSKLVTSGGQRLLFHKLKEIQNVDIYEAVTFSGDEWFIIFLDMYHPRKSRIAPEGFMLSPSVCLISGFGFFCDNFPYDFMQMRQREDLRWAYIPTWDILRGIESGAFDRPAAHMARLERLETELELASVEHASEIHPATDQYYSLIERAILSLPDQGRERREAIYGQARTVLLVQMHGLTPPPSQSVILGEQRALEAAIQRMEDKVSGDRKQTQ